MNQQQNLQEDSSETSSVDTNEAFMEMLGLSMEYHHNGLPDAVTCYDDNGIKVGLDHDNKYANLKSDDLTNNQIISCTNIPIPNKCSRKYLSPSSCLALVLDNVFTKDQCEKLIQIAHGHRNTSLLDEHSVITNKASGFRYITEATHTAPDGSKFIVPIHNPNPHKLSVVDTMHHFKESKIKSSSSSSQSLSCSDDPTFLLNDLYQKIVPVLKSHPSFHVFTSRMRHTFEDLRGLNPRMRILKYDAEDNDRFEPHFDAITYVSSSMKMDHNKHRSTNSRNDSSDDETNVNGSVDDISKEDVQSNIHYSSRQYKSLITVLVYLNDGDGTDFDGGETCYLDYHTSTSYSTTTKNKTMTVEDSKLKDKSKVNSMNDQLFYNIDGMIKVIPKVGRVVLFEHDLFHSGAPLLWGTKYIMRTDILFEQNEYNNEQNHHDENGVSYSNHHDSSSEGSNSDACPKLVSDLCHGMNLSERDKAVLVDMDLFSVSFDLFLAPGVVALKAMLVDGGMNETVALNFIQQVVQISR